MSSRLPWRHLLIAFLVILGVSGLVEALPHARESMGDLLVDAGILVLVVAVSAVLASIRASRRKSREDRS
jgi:hypothetical protein